MVGLTETVLRDGHQSLIATRMRTRHMLPIAERLDAIGYRSLEVWGGATFDVGLRYLREDPWERLRALKKAMPNTPLQMLLRGQNLVGYRPYADDLVDAFVGEAARGGIGIFRVFDALNDPVNMASALKAVKRHGAIAQGTICYTRSPVHTLASFVALGRTLAELGADEICVKDMAGFLPPSDAAALTQALVREVGLPVAVHTHSSAGLSTLSCLAAAEAGAASIDAAISPFSGGASQPPTESLVGAMQGTAVDPKLDLGALAEIAEYFSGVLEHYRPLLHPRSLATDPSILVHQVPGGMLSNLLSQLQEQDALGRLREVLSEIPRVREDLGFPPLVTPTSQIVGIQAVLNVLTGSRYREITREVRDYVRGVYGTPPGPVDAELRRRILATEPAVTGSPSERIPAELPAALDAVRSLVPAADRAEALSYALFPMVFESFVKARHRGLDWDTLSSAGLGVVGALRAAPPAPSAPPASRPGPGRPDRSIWALEGRSHLHARGGGFREGRPRDRR